MRDGKLYLIDGDTPIGLRHVRQIISKAQRYHKRSSPYRDFSVKDAIWKTAQKNLGVSPMDIVKALFKAGVPMTRLEPRSERRGNQYTNGYVVPRNRKEEK